MSCSYTAFCSNDEDYKCNEHTITAANPEKVYKQFMAEVNTKGFKKKFIAAFDISRKDEKLQTNTKMVLNNESWKYDKRIAESGLCGKAGMVAKHHCNGVSREDMPGEIGVGANCITKHFTSIKSNLDIKTDEEIKPKLTK